MNEDRPVTVVFGKRGLTGAPIGQAPEGPPEPPEPPPERWLRSHAVTIGVVGVLALGAYAFAAGTRCDPNALDEDGQPVDCSSHAGHGGGGWHSGGGTTSHASFGGFGEAGAGHGGLGGGGE